MITLELDGNGTITNVNEEGARLLGATPNDLIGSDWIREFVPMERIPDPEGLRKQFTAGPSGESRTVQCPVRTRDGIRTLRWCVETSQNHDGEHRITAFGIDVSDLAPPAPATDLQTYVRENQERLALATAAADLGVFDWDVDRDEANWENDRIFKIFGRPRRRGPLDLREFMANVIHPDDREAILNNMKDRRPGETIHVECRILREDDREERWIEVTGRYHQQERPGSLRLIGVLSDVTERKREEQQLRARETYFREMADSAPAILWVTNTLHDCTFLSREWHELTGQKIDESLGTGWTKTIHPDDRQQTRRAFMDAAENRLPFTIEYRVVDPSGQNRWVMDSGRPRWDADGTFQGYIGTVIDIHDRRTQEEELKKTHALIEGITEGSAEPIAAEDHDFRYLFFNEAYRKEFKKLWGVDIEVGMSMAEALAPWPAEQDKACALWRKALQGETFKIRETFGPRNSDQQVYDLRFSPVRDKDGNQIGAAHILSNVTESVRIEQALNESEERFRTLADNIAQFVWMTDETGWIFWYNKRWFEYTGTTLDEMKGWGWRKVHHPDHVDRVMEKVSRCFQTGEPWEDTFPLRGKDGRYRWFLSRAFPIRDSEGHITRWFGTNTDVTEQREAEEALRQADQRKDQFLAMLAHELRNPLGAMRSSLELLDMKAGAGAEEKDLAHSILKRQTEHMTRLIDDLMDIARITRGKIHLNKAEHDLREIAKQALADLQKAINKSGHSIDSHFDDAPMPVHLDPVRIEQVIINLLDNAIKYTPHGGHLTLRVQRTKAGAEVQVRDTGMGFDEDLAPHMFDLFTQADRSLARTEGGLGIGLTLVKSLVEMHGGNVTAYSEGHGKGSKFTLTLPLTEAASARQGGGESSSRAQSEGTQPSERPRVLVIDDNKDFALMTEALLKRSQYEVHKGHTGQEALHLAQQVWPQIVFLDIGLPDIDGYEVARRLRNSQATATAKIVAISGYGQPSDRAKSHEAGFDAHLIKPVDLKKLKSVIES